MKPPNLKHTLMLGFLGVIIALVCIFSGNVDRGLLLLVLSHLIGANYKLNLLCYHAGGLE